MLPARILVRMVCLQDLTLTLYEKILLSFPTLNLIASGGVSCLEDLHELKRIGVDGVIVGKAIYEGKISLKS